MPISSMTGYAKLEKNLQLSIGIFQLHIEVKTVNNRFKDIRTKIYPNTISFLEFEIKKMVEQEIKRGSIDLSITLKTVDSPLADKSKIGENTITNSIDLDKFKTFYETVQSQLTKNQNIQIQIHDFFRPEFSKSQPDMNEEDKNIIKNLIIQTIKQLKMARNEEGHKLEIEIQKLMKRYQDYLEQIKILKVSYPQKVKEKFEAKIKSLPSNYFDEGRLMQEVLYYLEKLDIDEEIQRIESHLKKFSEILLHEFEIGRKMEFFLQELHRETNTIGSKSGSLEITNNIVEMKVILEKIKEQSFNIE